MNVELTALPLPDRARRYRELGKDALHHAELATDAELKDSFLSIARGWHALAVLVEDEISANR